MQLIILIRQGRWPSNGRLTGWMTSRTLLTGRQRQTQQWQLSDGPGRQILVPLACRGEAMEEVGNGMPQSHTMVCPAVAL